MTVIHLRADGSAIVAIPENEVERVREVRGIGVLDTPPTKTFDRLTGLAALLVDAPMALLTLMDRERQWCKATCGVEFRQIPRHIALCAPALLGDGDDGYVVRDTLRDPLCATNPLVVRDPKIRFLVAMPLVGRNELKLGTLCVCDTTSRPDGVDSTTLHALKDIAALAVDMFYQLPSSQDKSPPLIDAA